MVNSPNEEFVKQNIQDLVEIANIDISCDFPDPDVHPQGIDSFVVAFDKVPHSITAGETRIFPRYLADHIAKHLADHLLVKEKKQVRDPIRPKILEEIYRGVKESYSAPRPETQGEIVAKQVQEVNVPPLAPKTTSSLKTPVPEITEVSGEKAGFTKERPTRADLFAECKELGIETKGDEKVDELVTKIQLWAGVSK